MKQFFFLIVAACPALCLAADGWIHDDMVAAQKQAAEQKKGILIEFTGSDWCGPCKVLRSKVLNTPEFMTAAEKHFVLLELDYPRQKAQEAKIKKANEQLADKYGIKGYPTVIFADEQGRPFSIFMGVKTADEVNMLMADALKKREAFIKAIEMSRTRSSRSATAGALKTALDEVPEQYVDEFYADIKASIIKCDPDDKMGLRAADARKKLVERQLKEVKAYFAANLGPYTDPDVALKVVKDCPNRDKVEPEVLQEILLTEWQCTLSATGDADAGIAVLDRVIKLNPNTQLAKEAAELKVYTDKEREMIKQRYQDQKRYGGKGK